MKKMSRRVHDNVYLFSGGNADKQNEAKAEPVIDSKEGGSEGRPNGIAKTDLEAIAECLQYLYRESNRLDATATSRLIGAAAVAITQDMEDRIS
jgi:hypothetical protein